MELKRGYFITFEGADGCGKTTQIKLIKNMLDEKNIANILTLEPGDTDLGRSLREILLHYDKPVASSAEMFLYLADRAQHVKSVFDVDSKIAQQRVGEEKDRLESEGLEFHKKVRNGYLELAKKYPQRIKVIDANQSIEEVFSNTKKIIGELLNL